MPDAVRRRSRSSSQFAVRLSSQRSYAQRRRGELSFNVFFLLSALAMLAAGARFPRWMGYIGALTALAGLIGMFRNVTDVVDPVAEVNNYLLPAWMIVFGVGLLRYRPAAGEGVTSVR
jgi:hypothetical protein